MTHPRNACTLVALALAANATVAQPAAWQQAGRQGIIHVVIVPLELARDRDAYVQQVPLICGNAPTCFVNFYTNSRNVAVSLPLPDEVMSEATAVLRRSDKQQTEGIRWSCRLQLTEPNCF